MNDNPLITVLMPVYNGEQYLADAIDSILDQTYNHFEFLILDDCSTDSSLKIIASFSDDRIRLVKNEENIGQSRTMNKGIKLSKGKYIARLDQDDLADVKRIEKQVKFLDNNLNIAVVGSHAIHIDSNGNPLCFRKLPVNSYSNLLYIITGKNPIIHPGVMFRKKVVEKIGCYREEYMPSEDIDLWLRLYQNSYVSENISEFLTKVRLHKMQISRTDNNIQNKKHMLAFSSFYKSVTKKDIDYDDIEQYFNVLVWRIKKVTLDNFYKILTILLELYRNLIPINKEGYNTFSKLQEIRLFQIFGLINLIYRSNIYSIIISKIWNR